VFLVDSTIWIDYFNGVQSPHTDYLDARLSKDLILVGDLMLAEVLQGFRNDADFAKARDALMRFRIVQMVTPKLAVQSAQNFRLLRTKGVTVRKTIDSLIATWCIENDVPLLHLDSDFDGYEAHLGLRVIHP
jgi:predicted nucleic acid-binding protein